MENKRKVVNADIFGGDLLVHFSGGEPVMFRANFLWNVRNEDGNQPIPASAGTEDEPFVLDDKGA